MTAVASETPKKAQGDGLARRRFPRRLFRRAISWLHQGHYCLGRGMEIGEGGMLIEGEMQMAVGDTLIVNFMMITGICMVKSEVRSIRAGADGLLQYGLQFINLTYDGKKGIREFISAKTEAESKYEMSLIGKDNL